MAPFSPDAPHAFDGQRREKVTNTRGRHDDQTVGLFEIARDLRHELARSDAGRRAKTGSIENRALDFACDRRAVAEERPAGRDVEERFVERQSLDEGRRLLEDAVQRLARLRVGRHPRLDNDRVRALAHMMAMGIASERRTGAPVRGRHHDARPDFPPTSTGLPRIAGSSSCSTDA